MNTDYRQLKLFEGFYSEEERKPPIIKHAEKRKHVVSVTNDAPLLFSQKEMYVATRTSSGLSPMYQTMTSNEVAKYRYGNIYLAEGLNFTSSGMPILNPYSGDVDFECIAFDKRNKATGKGQAVHFFIDDYKFANQMWNRLEQTVSSLSKFDYVFTPDYSCHVDAPEMINRMSIYMTRFDGAYMQQVCGYNVIPTYCFGDVDSLKFCLDGLPVNSVIAVCGVGIKWNSTITHLWKYAIRRLEEEKSPTLILVYGEPIEIEGLHTPVRFIQDQISKYFRNLKTIDYGNSTNI